MKAEIISVSSELLRGQKLNENTAFLAREMLALGIEVTRNVEVGDSKEDLSSAIQSAEKNADLIIMTGGLGPDEDDITKTTLSEHLDIPLAMDEESQNRIIAFHENSDFELPENSQLQALVLPESTPIRNVRGLATGFLYTKKKTTYLLLPGPFEELEAMFYENTLPALQKELLGEQVVETQLLRAYGLTLTQTNELLSDLITYEGNPIVATYFDNEEIEIQLTARSESKENALEMISDLSKEVKDRLGDYVYAENGDSLAKVLKDLLRDNNKKITAAESLTGGTFLSMLTEQPESGDILGGGMVTYSEEVKQDMLGVSSETIEEKGVVSAETAIEMADQARKKFETNYSVSLTGVAGPSSLEAEIPGTVWIGVSSENEPTFAKLYHFNYNRNRNRVNSVLTAMDLVRKLILDIEIEDKVFLS